MSSSNELPTNEPTGNNCQTVDQHTSEQSGGDDLFFNEDECFICKEVIGETREDGSVEEATTTPCNHRFGKDCLDQWLKHGSTCPMCRATLRAPAPAAPQPRTIERRIMFLQGGVYLFVNGTWQPLSEEDIEDVDETHVRIFGFLAPRSWIDGTLVRQTHALVDHEDAGRNDDAREGTEDMSDLEMVTARTEVVVADDEMEYEAAMVREESSDEEFDEADDERLLEEVMGFIIDDDPEEEEELRQRFRQIRRRLCQVAAELRLAGKQFSVDSSDESDSDSEDDENEDEDDFIVEDEDDFDDENDGDSDHEPGFDDEDDFE